MKQGKQTIASKEHIWKKDLRTQVLIITYGIHFNF